jgi:hypothetical protein
MIQISSLDLKKLLYTRHGGTYVRLAMRRTCDDLYIQRNVTLKSV